MTLVGGILLAYSVIQYIMAFIHSTADESANASKGLAVGIAFSCGGGIMKGLRVFLPAIATALQELSNMSYTRLSQMRQLM